MMKHLSMVAMMLIVTFFGFGIIIPVIPGIVSPAHLAIMLASYSAASFIMSPIWGAWSDRIGRRPIILIGIFGFSISFAIFGFFVGNLFWMYTSRILGGIFSGAVMSSAVAYVADVTDEEHRTKGMGIVGMSIGIGFIFGPAVGGILSLYGNAVPFLTSALIALCLFVFVSMKLKESLPAEKRSHKREKAPSRWTAFQGPMKYLYVLSFFVSFTLAGLETVLLYFQNERIGAGSFEFGMMLLISGIVGAGIQGGVIRKYVKQGTENRFILAGLLLTAFGFFLLLLSHNFFTAALYLSIFSAGNAFLRPCVTSLITQKTKVGQGVATGLNSSMDSLGRILGPLLGAGAFYLHLMLPFIIGGLLSLAAIGLLYRFMFLERLEKSHAGN